MPSDLTAMLQERVRAAAAARTPLVPRGQGTRTFLGRAPAGAPLELAGHTGILDYQPRELTITARCGTPLTLVEATLAEAGQRLPFEPPRHGEGGGTLGGVIACGLSGPARPHAGAARDLTLGARILNGQGEVLRFGGAVMKNVAGYDVSRLMVGAQGTLGILLEISLKVLPIPAETATRTQDCDLATALGRLRGWAARPLPIDATCHDGERLWIRCSGSPAGVRAALERIGGEPVAPLDASGFWDAIRDQRHPLFTQEAGGPTLWRLSVPDTAPPLDLPGIWLIEWGGAQRWLRTAASASQVRAIAGAAGGHATRWHGCASSPDADRPFHPLPPALLQLHRRLKLAFDPKWILNPGRLHPEL